jgi:hypothetical protein
MLKHRKLRAQTHYVETPEIKSSTHYVETPDIKS